MKQKKSNNYGTVFSTGQGRICPGCGQATVHCTCHSKKSAPQGDGIVRVGRETKGRRGKAVTVIKGVPLDHDRLVKLVQELKQQCGSGGTVKNGVIELQGDHRDKLVEELKQRGYTVKLAGG